MKHFFYIRRSDRRVLCFLLAVAVIVIAVIVFADHDGGPFSDSGQADSAGTTRGYSGYASPYGQRGYGGSYSRKWQGPYAVAPRPKHLFPFDPNTADSTQLLDLGLRPWQVRNIYKYRAAGGVFHRKEYFARIYGLTPAQYRELEPYIKIDPKDRPHVEFNEPRPRHVNIPDSIALHSVAKLKAGETIELNSADSTQLMRVPGIGRFYARQIENRRHWLGGFYTTDQLMEIEYLPKEAMNYFTVDASLVRKLDANRATLQELKRHPYINYYQARDIVDYRRLRGPLHSIDDLRLMKDFSSRDIELLSHYLSF